MADFSMCKAIYNCIQKDICQRYTYTPEPNDQTYMRFHNICDKDNDWYWFYGDRSQMVKVELIEDKAEELVVKEDET